MKRRTVLVTMAGLSMGGCLQPSDCFVDNGTSDQSEHETVPSKSPGEKLIDEEFGKDSSTERKPVHLGIGNITEKSTDFVVVVQKEKQKIFENAYRFRPDTRLTYEFSEVSEYTIQIENALCDQAASIHIDQSDFCLPDMKDPECSTATGYYCNVTENGEMEVGEVPWA